MKYKLPILTVVVVLLTTAAWNRERVRRIVDYLRSPKPTAPLSVVEKPKYPPSEHLNRSVEQLNRIPHLEAKLRVRVELLGHSLSGVGSYLQSASDPNRLSRLELKMQVADRVASFLQICDGRFIWQRDDLQAEPRLVRLDLRRLRESIDEDTSQPSEWSAQPWLLLGGLSRLLRDLNDNFVFVKTTATQRGGIPVWVLDGIWKPERLVALAPALRAEVESGNSLSFSRTPGFLPHYLRVTIGRDEELPGFPYFIEYLRTEGSSWKMSATGEEQAAKAAVSMEIYEVRIVEQIDASQFKYNPANQDVIDRTDELLTRAFETTREANRR